MHATLDSRTLLDGLSSPIAVLDNSGAIVYANRAFSRACGSQEGQEAAGRFIDAWPAMGKVLEDARYLHALTSREPVRMEHDCDALRRRFEISVKPVDAEHVSIEFREVGAPATGAADRAGTTTGTTEHPYAALHARMLADMGACLRADLGAAETFYQVASILGRLPGVSRATFGTVDNERHTITIHRDFCRDIPSMAGTYPMSDAETTSRELGGGRVVVITDVLTDYRSHDAPERRFKLGYRACVAIPLMRDGQWAATLMVQSPLPREWSADEVELIRTAAERTWLAVENVRLLREARQANAAKDQFLAVLSHELRTPLTPVVMTLASLESRDALPAEVRDDLAMIRRNIDLETQLIDDLLDITRIVNGKLRLAPRLVRVHELLQHVCGICSADAAVGGIELTCRLNADRDTVVADPARLEQVFWNLVKNAIKFTPAGGSVRLTTAREGQELLLAVADTGSGIAPDVLPRIFNAFEQGEQNVTRTFGGLGLGLAISKAIVDLHGGRIWATSEGINRGSTLHVALRLNVSPPDGADPVSPSSLRARIGQRAESISVLLVDDNGDTVRIMKRILMSWGMRVRTATSVREALGAIGEEKFDLMISDIGLPDGSGCDLAAQLRKVQPIPAIALSGFGMETDIKRSLGAGFAAHLTKPVSLEQLRAVIAGLL